MRKPIFLIAALLAVTSLCGCSLLTPSVTDCREQAIASIASDGRWHASITVKGSTEGGGDFTAEGESDIDIAGAQYRSHGYFRVFGTYLKMEQKFDVITDTLANTRSIKANAHGLYVQDTPPSLFPTDLTAFFEQDTSRGRFVNRTVEFRDTSCYMTSCSMSDLSVITDFFPGNTKKVIGKDYITDIANMDLRFYFDGESRFIGAEASCSGDIAVQFTITRSPDTETIEMPTNVTPLDSPDNQPLLYSWNMYFFDNEKPLDVKRKDPAAEDVRMAQDRGINSTTITIDGQAIEFPCKLSELERAGFYVDGSAIVQPYGIQEFPLKRTDGDVILASVYNDKQQEIDCKEAIVLSLTIASEEVENTAFVFPCGITFCDSEATVTKAYGEPKYREDIDEDGLFVMGYYQLSNTDAMISYYNDMVDEIEIGLHEYEKKPDGERHP